MKDVKEIGKEIKEMEKSGIPLETIKDYKQESVENGEVYDTEDIRLVENEEVQEPSMFEDFESTGEFNMAIQNI